MDNNRVNNSKTSDLLDAYKTVFGTPEGQLVLEDMKEGNFINSTTALNDVADPSTMLIHEGQRRAVLYILQSLTQTVEDIKDQASEGSDVIGDYFTDGK